MVYPELLGSTQIYYQVARFFIVFLVGVAVTRVVAMPVVSRLLGGSDKKRLYSARNLVGILGVFVTLTVALQAAAFGNLVTVIGTVAAALTVAIGFGMREQVGNLVSGFFIQVDNPFVKEDYVETEKVEGVIKNIKLRDTEVRSPSGEKVVVPNSYLSNNPLKNRTRGRTTTGSFTVNVPMSRAEEAEEIYLEVAEENDRVLEEPEPSAYFSDISDDDEVVMHFSYSVRDSDNTLEIRDRLLRSLTTRLVEEGITAGEPQEN